MSNLDIHKETPEEIAIRMINRFEELGGESLAISDERRMLLNTIAYGLFVRNEATNEGFKMNFVRYTKGEFADEIGVFTDTKRLPNHPASTTLRIDIGGPQSETVAVSPTRFTPGNNIYFMTSYFEFKQGETSKDIVAICTEDGEIGNGYLPGEINKIVDPFPFFKSVTNLEITQGGAEVESDSSLRERIREAPSKFSTAGPVNGYIYWAKTANQDIIDVNAGKVSPGKVKVTPLMVGGELPNDSVLEDVYSTCNASDRRPLTDELVVEKPAAILYDIQLTYYISESKLSIVNEIKSKVEEAVKEYIKWQRGALKRDINPDELMYLIRAAGAKRTTIVKPIFSKVNDFQVAHERDVSVTFGGVEDD